MSILKVSNLGVQFQTNDGMVNAVNIIDGFNGLASMVCCFMLAALAYDKGPA